MSPEEVLDEIEDTHFKDEYATLVCVNCGSTLFGESPPIETLCVDCKDRLDYLYYNEK